MRAAAHARSVRDVQVALVNPDVSVRIQRPPALPDQAPVLLWYARLPMRDG
jgi:hypothetical protein